ncbi:MAG: SMP-30/gluconolactonase/LRE family protein [SAR202 cluster bacterium]|nr:SMP-30/gluconolactonase/LRE family protein [SAR202 cluster bacterium]
MDNVVYDKRFHDLVDTRPLWMASDKFGFPEGPVFLPSGYVIFSDILHEEIIRFYPPFWFGKERVNSGGANGNTLDLQGRLISCEGTLRQLTRREHDGSITVLASHYDGKPLNATNDVVVKNDGAIYFTDPYFMGSEESWLAPSLAAQDACGVYRLDPKGALKRLHGGIEKPNGLAFSPDEKTLYVVNSADNAVYAFAVKADGSLANKKTWLEMGHGLKPAGDGMKVDTQGNAYVTGPGGVWVADGDGTPLGVISVPTQCTNVAFYGWDSKLLFITAPPAVYVIRLKVPGISVIDRIRS